MEDVSILHFAGQDADDALGCDVAADVVAGSGEIVNHDAARSGCMDELEGMAFGVYTDAETDVSDTMGGASLKENEVAGLDVAALHGFALRVLVTAGARKGVAETAEYVRGEAGAVESVGTCRSMYISFAEMLSGFCDDGVDE